MPVIAVVNRKGGSGKSTLATHLAAYYAHAGSPVLLGDVDRQLSTQTWLRLRSAQAALKGAAIVGRNIDPKTFVRPPAGNEYVILDTPGGLRGFDLARVVMYADAVLMPVCNSVFDRESAAECLAELRTLPRIGGGRCKVAAIGMRLDARTHAIDVLRQWATGLDLTFLGALRETQGYVRCIDRGLALFDLPPDKVRSDLAQWEPIVQWLASTLVNAAASATEMTRKPIEARESVARGLRPAAQLPAADVPAPAAMAQPQPMRRPAPAAAGSKPSVENSPASRVNRLLDALPIPRFLQRTS